jgi:cyclophilin family peptidyl-prolyl cis-trans isomerase
MATPHAHPTTTRAGTHPEWGPQRVAGAAALLAALLMAGCGGGDYGAPLPPVPPPVVSSAVAGPVKYSQTLVIAIDGFNLSGSLSASSTGCRDLALSTTAPYVSSDNRAYFSCTASALGAQRIDVRDAYGGALLATVSFTVPVPQVTMTVSNGATVAGSMTITLAPDKTPLTVDNFLAYVNSGFYAGTIFHRVVPGFVVQGGGYLPLASGAAPVAKARRAPIALEVGRGLTNAQWTIGMARTPDPDSATSEFYINLDNNAADLDPGPFGPGYAVFGNVSLGTDLVNAIVAAPCSPVPGFSECAPNPNMVITAALQSR